MEIMEQTKKELSDATLILTLGILSLVFCWCCGVIGLILGVVTVVLAGSQRRLYLANPELYTEGSYKNVNTGRTCAIIGICIAVCTTILGIVLSLFHNVCMRGMFS